MLWLQFSRKIFPFLNSCYFSRSVRVTYVFSMDANTINIDGGAMEGGGQILRMSVALSTLLKIPIKVSNIRAGRQKPGLRPQHLSGLKLVAELCDGKLDGGYIGSTEITFRPGKIKQGKFYADPGTAGSITLLFQVAFPCLLFAPGPTELHCKGGTNVEMAPQIDYTLMVFKPILERFGIKFECEISTRGYYPKGGGEVIFKTTPVDRSIKPIELVERGAIDKVFGLSFVSGGLNIRVAHIAADVVKDVIRPHYLATSLQLERTKFLPNESFGTANGVVVIASSQNGCLVGNSMLGKRGLSAESVGESVAQTLLEDLKSGACVDHYLQDQLIIFMVLADGKSRVLSGKLTLHTETAIYIAEKLTKAKFAVTKCDEMENQNIIECKGIGLQRK